MVSPLMISAKDDFLVRVGSRMDPMGTLAVASDRAREIVPHLTVQTTQVRGFQILVEALRLWEDYESEHGEHAGRVFEFVVLIEQAFAGAIGQKQPNDWQLPGRRRLLARDSSEPCVSLSDRKWSLLTSHPASGIWAQYRGAATRAGMLDQSRIRLSEATLEAAKTAPCLDKGSASALRKLVKRAMDGETVRLADSSSQSLLGTLCVSYHRVPLRRHLKQRLIDGHPLNRELANRLVGVREFTTPNYREFLTVARDNAPPTDGFRKSLDRVIACENLLAVLDSLFHWICGNTSKSLQDVAESLQPLLDLEALENAKREFGIANRYKGETAKFRHGLYCDELKASGFSEVVESVLKIHEIICRSRGYAPQVWTEPGGKLLSDVEAENVDASEFEIGKAWRNHYYLGALRDVVRQIKKLESE